MSLQLTNISLTLKTYADQSGCVLSAEVTGVEKLVVTFSGTPGGTLNGGVTYTVDGGGAQTFDSGVNLSGNEVTYTDGTKPFAAVQVVHWLYTPGNITCGGNAIDAQDVTANNPL